MSKINLTYIQGNLTRDPELRHVGRDGTPLATFAIAHNRSYQRDGEWQRQVSFVDIKCWGDLAARMAADGTKGLEVIVAGRLEQEAWTGKDGAQRTKLLLVADRVDLVGQSKAPRHAEALPQEDDDLPF